MHSTEHTAMAAGVGLVASFAPGDLLTRFAFAIVVSVVAPRAGRALDALWRFALKRFQK